MGAKYKHRTSVRSKSGTFASGFVESVKRKGEAGIVLDHDFYAGQYHYRVEYRNKETDTYEINVYPEINLELSRKQVKVNHWSGKQRHPPESPKENTL